MTENAPAQSAPPEDEPSPAQQDESAAEPADAEPEEDPGYLTETGEAVGEDGSVVPIIGGLPAAEGSAWDIGAPADERGAALAEHEARRHEGEASPPDTR